MIRYMAKVSNVCFVIKPRNALITNNAEKNETKKPTAKMGRSFTDR